MKLNWYILTLTEVFLNQKKINVCEHTVTMIPHHVCSHTFILFSLRKTSVSVKMSLSFCVPFWFICAFHPETSSFFRYFSTFPLTQLIEASTSPKVYLSYTVLFKCIYSILGVLFTVYMYVILFIPIFMSSYITHGMCV